VIAVGYLGAFAGVVVLVQSVAWLGARRTGTRRRRQAMLLAPAAVVLLLLSLLHVLVPDFWAS
jgi:hypothetical protein